MKIRVVTSFSPKGFETYGKMMLRTFEWGWPKDVQMTVYHESSEPADKNVLYPFDWINLDDDQGRKAFMERHTDPVVDYKRLCYDHHYAATYYKALVVKFSHKVFALTSAPRDCDWLIWLDGDVETLKPVTKEFLASVLPDNVVASYLGRHWWTHTESGFLAVRLSDTGKQFLDDLRNFYTSDKIMELKSKTDCDAFDHLRLIYEARGHKFNNLGAMHRGPSIDVMAHSALAPYLFHNKGASRKLKAYGAVA